MKKTLLASLTTLCWFCFVRAESGKPLKTTYLPTPDAVVAADSKTDSLPSPKLGVSASNAFASSYYWRGLTFNEGLMLQPSATVTYGRWFATGWSNVVAMETKGNAFVPEVDLTAGFTVDKDKFTATPQANLFFYPSNARDVATLELGAEMFYDLQNIGLYLNPNFDIGANDGGVYVDYGIYKRGSINDKWSYDTRFILGWGNKIFCNYYNPVEVVETIAKPDQLKPQTMKTMRLQFATSYQATNRWSVQPQLIAFRNFMTEYTSTHDVVKLNGSLTCSYAF